MRTIKVKVCVTGLSALPTSYDHCLPMVCDVCPLVTTPTVCDVCRSWHVRTDFFLNTATSPVLLGAAKSISHFHDRMGRGCSVMVMGGHASLSL